MQFRLVYEGSIAPRQKIKLQDLHSIRTALHLQMKALWQFPPLQGHCETWLRHLSKDDTDTYALYEQRGAAIFVPLISKRNDLTCELDITFLRQQAAGQLLGDGGDIDNRVKTLLDALSVPPNAQSAAFADGPSQPIFCLLQDDSLVTKISVETDRLLRPAEDVFDLVAIIKVYVRASRVTFGTIALIG
jgi:hypothetical protein